MQTSFSSMGQGNVLPAVMNNPLGPSVQFGNTPKKHLQSDTVMFGATPKKASKGTNFKAALYLLMGSILGGGTVGVGTMNHYDGKVDQIVQERTILQERIAELNDELATYDMADLAAEVAAANVTVYGKYSKGSGTWLRDADGNLYIITKADAVRENNSIYYNYNDDTGYPPTFRVQLHNDSDLNDPVEVHAQLVEVEEGKYAISEDTGLALLAVSTPNFVLPDNVNPVELRDLEADPLEVGERVLAVGSPFDMKNTVTAGIISHTERVDSNNEALIFVGTDAPMGQQSWGGALYDAEGRLIGINYKNISTFRGNADGLAFSVRVDVVEKVLSEWGVKT